MTAEKLDEVFEAYSTVLNNGFAPDRIWFNELQRCVDQEHPLTEEEFAIVFPKTTGC